MIIFLLLLVTETRDFNDISNNPEGGNKIIYLLSCDTLIISRPKTEREKRMEKVVDSLYSEMREKISEILKTEILFVDYPKISSFHWQEQDNVDGPFYIKWGYEIKNIRFAIREIQ